MAVYVGLTVRVGQRVKFAAAEEETTRLRAGSGSLVDDKVSAITVVAVARKWRMSALISFR